MSSDRSISSMHIHTSPWGGRELGEEREGGSGKRRRMEGRKRMRRNFLFYFSEHGSIECDSVGTIKALRSLLCGSPNVILILYNDKKQ